MPKTIQNTFPRGQNIIWKAFFYISRAKKIIFHAKKIIFHAREIISRARKIIPLAVKKSKLEKCFHARNFKANSQTHNRIVIYCKGS